MLKLPPPPKILLKALAALLEAGYVNSALTYNTSAYYTGWRVRVNADPTGSVFGYDYIDTGFRGNPDHVSGAVTHASIQGVLINAGLQTLEGWPRAKLTPCANPTGEKCRYECVCPA